MARIAMTVAGLGTAAVLTACGGNDFADGSADEIAKSSKSAMGDLSSVKVSGDITSGGQQISLDLQADTDGNCTGTIGIGSGAADLLGVDGTVWMKPDGALWQSIAADSADQVMALVGDKWVVVPAGADSLGDFCDIDTLLDQMLKDDDSSNYSKAGTGSVDGDDVVKIDNTDDKGTSTGYVLVDDPHYLVKIEKTEGEDTGSVTFSDFNAKVDVEAPDDSDIVDLDKLMG